VTMGAALITKVCRGSGLEVWDLDRFAGWPDWLAAGVVLRAGPVGHKNFKVLVHWRLAPLPVQGPGS
jgi:hypothetical protein